NIPALGQQRDIALALGLTQHFDSDFQADQILSEAVVQLARDPSALLILNTQKPAAQLSQCLLRISPRCDVHDNDPELREYPAAFANRKVIHQPIAQFTRLSRQLCRNLAIKYGLAGPQYLLQQQVRVHAALAKYFRRGSTLQLVRFHTHHARKRIVKTRTAKVRIENYEADGGG